MIEDISQGSPRPLRPPRWAWRAGIGLTLLLAAFYLFADAFHLRYFLDFEVYRAGARAFLNGEAIYERDYDMGIITLPFTYPPIAALLFAPLAWLPSAVGAIALLGINIFCLWWGSTLTLRHCLPLHHRQAASLWALCVLPLALLAEPVRETLVFGQINLILMALVATDILGRHRLPRGVLVGLAAAIKLTPAVFGLYFLVKRDWKAAAWSVASALGLSALSAALSPGNSITYWTHTLADTNRIGSPFYASNQSLQGFLYRLNLDPGVISLLWVAASVLCVLAAAWTMHRLLSVGALPAALVVNSLVALICSPVSWSHHWVWFVPAALVTGCAAIQGRKVMAGLSAAIAAAVIFAPHWRLPNNGPELHWPLWALPLGNSYFLLALIFLCCAMFFPRLFTPAAPAESAVSRD